MTNAFTPPPANVLAMWNNGDTLTDEQLNEIEQFFSAMTRGCDAMGERFSLATIAFREEWNHAARLKRVRDHYQAKHQT